MSYIGFSLHDCITINPYSYRNEKHNYYDDVFRLKVVSDYYASGLSKCESSRKHNLPDHASLCNWLKRFPLLSELVSLPEELKSELIRANNKKLQI